MRGSLLAVYVIWDSPASLSFYVSLSLSLLRDSIRIMETADAQTWSLTPKEWLKMRFLVRTGCRKTSFTLICQASRNTELKFKDSFLVSDSPRTVRIPPQPIRKLDYLVRSEREWNRGKERTEQKFTEIICKNFFLSSIQLVSVLFQLRKFSSYTHNLQIAIRLVQL